MDHTTESRVRGHEFTVGEHHDNCFHGDDLIPGNHDTSCLGEKWLSGELEGHRTTTVDQNIKPVGNKK